MFTRKNSNDLLTNITINYDPCVIFTSSIGNIINNNTSNNNSLESEKEIELFVSGRNQSKSHSFFQYLTYSLNNDDISEKSKNENTKLFKIWNYTPHEVINFIFPFKTSPNNQFSDGIFIFNSKFEALLKSENYNNYTMDDEVYSKPKIDFKNELVYGLIADIGLKIFDLNKKETQKILYPGKKHIFNDYIICNENKNIIFTCEDKKIYIYDVTDEKCSISRPSKMEIDLLSEASINGQRFYGYSYENSSLYLYDIRNFNQFVDVIKKDVDINKMIYDKNKKKLFFLEDGSGAIISIDDKKQEDIYETHKQIKDFNINEDNKYMNIIMEDNSINIINY